MKKIKLSIDALQKLHQEGNLEEAKRGYLEILKENPKAVDALHLLGILYAEEGNLESAQDYLERTLAINKKNPTPYLHLANVLKARGLFSQAVEILLDVIQKHPDFAAAFNNLGTVYFSQAKLEQAVEAYQSALLLQPNYIDAYYNLGLALSKLNRKDEAINAYQALLELVPQHAGARFQLACLFMQKDKYEAAIKNFSLIEKVHPFHFETQSNIATSYLKLGQLEQAMHHYQKALEINPNDVQVLFNLGVISMQLGLMQEAIQYYLTAVKNNPDLYDAHNNLAFAFLTLKKNTEALIHFREALRIQPDNTAVKHTIDILSGEKNITNSPPEYVRALFNSYADHFDMHLQTSLQYQVPQQFLKALEEVLQGKKVKWNILDLGCGTGLCGELFKSFAEKLTGVDISEKMLAIAAQKNIYDDLVHADLLSFLQDKKSEFDLIIAGDVLVYFGELAPLFSAVAKALKKDGLFLFDTEISEEENYCMTTSGRFIHKKEYLEKLAKQNNLQILQYKKIPMRTQNQEIVYGHLYILKHA